MKAEPYFPKSDDVVLAELPAGITHHEVQTRGLAQNRIDVALPLAQFYISRARITGDLRFLGYAEQSLKDWVGRDAVSADALVLHATLLQSRHAFDAALAELDRALVINPNHAQAWLTRATVLRVLGRYDEAAAACAKLAAQAGNEVNALCSQSLLALNGHLPSAYEALRDLSEGNMSLPVRVWRASELGEMAVRLGREAEAERWFKRGLAIDENDAYLRSAYADLLLRAHRPVEVLSLLKGRESMEPMLLRIAIAQQQLNSKEAPASNALLTAAFDAEAQRGEAVHRREQARFLLDVERQPRAALAAALENWRVQREPDDALVLLRAAQASRASYAAAPVVLFVREHALQDARLTAFLSVKP